MNYDVIIIGAGPSGLCAALNFDANTRIAIIESGGTTVSDEAQALNKVEKKNKLIRERIHHTRARALGGTSHLWTGHITPLEPHEFDGDRPLNRWPIDYQDIKPWYDKAASFFGIDPDFSLAKWDKKGTLQSAFADNSLNGKIWQFNRIEFGAHYRERLESAENIDVFLNSTALGVQSGNHRIQHVLISNGEESPLPVACNFLILAQGGLEVPRFLHLCADDNKSAFKEIQRSIGRFFCVHPHLFWGAALFTDKLADSPLMRRTEIGGHKVGASLQINPDIIAENDWVDVSLRQELPQKLDDSKAYDKTLLGHLNYHRHAVMYDSVHLLMAMRPLGNSRIDLSSQYRDRFGQPLALINANIDEKTVLDAKAATQFIGQMLGANDQGRLQFALDEFFLKRFYHKGILTGHHYMCATRMADEARFGVVDADTRVFGFDNLYVAGPSAMSTPGSVNPTFTAGALAIRLANHIQQRI